MPTNFKKDWCDIMHSFHVLGCVDISRTRSSQQSAILEQSSALCVYTQLSVKLMPLNPLINNNDSQYPDHVRTAASNVAKSLSPPPILLENEAAAANFVGK